MKPGWIIRFCNQRGPVNSISKKESCNQLDALVLQRNGADRGPPSTSTTGLQFSCLPARRRFTRGNGGVVTDLPPDTADTDWGGSRAISYQLAEAALSGDLFTPTIAAIHRLRSPPVPE